MQDGTVNLKPLNQRSEEEVKAITSKGGKASGKARRKKKELKQLLELALSQPCKDTDDDNYMAITVALIQKALSGDVRAYEAIRDTIGQKPTEQQQVDMTAKIEVDYGED